MPIITITPPESEPLSLTEAKLFLRVDQDNDDALIEALIRASREVVEAASGRALMVRRVLESLDQWSFDSRGAIALGVGPVSLIHGVRVAGHDGNLQTIEPEAYELDGASAPPRLVFPALLPPSPGSSVAGIEIEYDAGYGDGADDAPESLRHAVRLTLCALYEDRHGAIAAPPAALALLTAFRELRL